MSFFVELVKFYRYKGRHKEQPLDVMSIFGAIFMMLVFVFLVNAFWPNDESVMVANRPNVSIDFMLVTLLIIAPLLEEITFRYSIGYFKVSRVSTSVSLLIGYFVAISFYAMYPQLQLYWYYAAVVIIASPIFFALYGLGNRRLQTIQRFWDSHLFEMIYLSAVLFSIAHLIVNNSLTSVSHAVVSFVVLFVFALVSCFIKVRFGLLYSILFHFAMNLPSALRLLLIESLKQ